MKQTSVVKVFSISLYRLKKSYHLYRKINKLQSIYVLYPASNLISTRCRTNILLISDRYRKQYLSDIALPIGFKSDQYLVGILSGRYRAYIKIVVYPSLVLYSSDIGYKSFRLPKQKSSVLWSGYLYSRSMNYKSICKRICICKSKTKKRNCKL